MRGCAIVLIIVSSVKEINWNYIGDAIPSFLTIIMIPLSKFLLSFVLSLSYSYHSI
jgi:adenine/guanine/hypoxanthine permease